MTDVRLVQRATGLLRTFNEAGVLDPADVHTPDGMADDLDAACMRHDACYDAAGYRSCACDRTLRDEAA